MALVEVARLWNLAEARVAQSSLQAAGLTVFVFDEHRAGLLWTEQLALGGIRLMTPETQAEDARLLMGEARGSTAPLARVRRREWVSGAALLLACFVFGWTLAGFKREDWFHRIAAACLISLLAVVFIAVRFVR